MYDCWFRGCISKLLYRCLPATSYHVSVKTGNVRGAGTDANVYLKIFGDKGDTGTLWLQSSENNKNKFEKDRTDLFKPEAADIGKVRL